MPNLRSVVAQVHQKSRWIGSHRNFSSSPYPEAIIAGKFRIQLKASFSYSVGLGVIVYGYKELFRYYRYLPTLNRRLDEEKLVLQLDDE